MLRERAHHGLGLANILLPHTHRRHTVTKEVEEEKVFLLVEFSNVATKGCNFIVHIRTARHTQATRHASRLVNAWFIETFRVDPDVYHVLGTHSSADPAAGAAGEG